MKNKKLHELNFKFLLDYPNEFRPQNRYDNPIICDQFCVSCEKNGYLDGGDLRLDQMSHGADTEDIEKSICCNLPPGGLDISVAFLLESPGGYYDLGSPIKHKEEGITKRPPVKHYYWTPSPRARWPKTASELPSKADGDGMYGPYFAYLIATHKLYNAYFTNIIKCSLAQHDAEVFVRYYVVRDPDNRDSKIRTNCFQRFLSKEMEIVNPQIVFYFGQRATKMGYYAGLHDMLPRTEFRTLYHPAAWCDDDDIIRHNDEIIQDAIKQKQSASIM